MFVDIEHMETAKILGELHHMDDRPWAEFRGTRPLTPIGLAKLLRPFEIGPRKWRVGSKTYRGYHRCDCEDAWQRYVPW